MGFRLDSCVIIVSTFVALLPLSISARSDSLDENLLDQKTAAGLCTNCSNSVAGVGSIEGVPVDAKTLKMFGELKTAIRKDVATRAKSRCEQIATSPACTDVYAKIKAAGNNPDDYKLKCNQNEIIKLVEDDFYLQMGVVKSVKSNLKGIAEIPKSAWDFTKTVYQNLNRFGQKLGGDIYCDTHLQDKKLLFQTLNANLPTHDKFPNPTDRVLSTYSCPDIREAFRVQEDSLYHPKHVSEHAVDDEIAHDFHQLVEKPLEKLHVKIKCYNSQKRSLLIGAATTSVAINFTPIGDGEKIAEAAGLVSDADKLAEVAKVAGAEKVTETAATSAEREQQIYAVLKRMNKLKKYPSTKENIAKIDELNTKAVQITADELRARGISFKIVDPKKDEGVSLSKNALDRVKMTYLQTVDSQKKTETFYHAAREELIKHRDEALHAEKSAGVYESVWDEKLQNVKKKISDLDQKTAVDQNNPIALKTDQALREHLVNSQVFYERAAQEQSETRIKWQRKVRRFEKKIRKLDRHYAKNKGLYPSLDKVPDLRDLHTWTRPYIVITESPTNPKLLNTIIEKHGGEIVLSPNEKSAIPSRLAGVYNQQGEKSVFIYPLEQIFGDHPTINGPAIHEIRHLTQERMRQMGRETPYNIAVSARQGQKLHKPRGFYDDYMSFEELHTWNHDMNDAVNPRIGEAKAYDFKRGILHRGNPTTTQVSIAKGLSALSKSAKSSVQAARVYLNEHPDAVSIAIKGENGAKESYVRVPYMKNGHVIGYIKITLVNLNENNKTDAIQLAKEYLDRVEARVDLHASNAAKVIDAHPEINTKAAWVPTESSRGSSISRDIRASIASPQLSASEHVQAVRRIQLTEENLNHVLHDHIVEHATPELKNALEELRVAQEDIAKTKNAKIEDVLKRRKAQETIISEIEKQHPGFKALLERKNKNTVIIDKNIEDVESMLGNFAHSTAGHETELRDPATRPIMKQAHEGDDFWLQTNYYEENGKKYGVEMYVCPKPTCEKDGKIYERGTAFTVYFTCGPNVLLFMKAKNGTISARLNDCK